ncbi:hypothetical protein QP027_03950 [Corynebacterium breve]|uniref:Uncharacterized protein n=2 Tax=Corynebacterium breve TaxID=3049799 RepID=A0ABY8VJ56_9CORY|nr:hypothetical protein [Corynebacterium breve]WIM69006.1 hypothetical protein QP027_03950 [Corynebacterium breve]
MGAIFSLLLEVVYLSTWIGGFPFPYTIVVAFFFNMVLTRTALLWTDNVFVALIPLAAWIVGFVLLMFGVEVTGDMLMANNIRTVLLLFSGLAGGIVPVLKTK